MPKNPVAACIVGYAYLIPKHCDTVRFTDKCFDRQAKKVFTTALQDSANVPAVIGMALAHKEAGDTSDGVKV